MVLHSFFPVRIFKDIWNVLSSSTITWTIGMTPKFLEESVDVQHDRILTDSLDNKMPHTKSSTIPKKTDAWR